MTDHTITRDTLTMTGAYRSAPFQRATCSCGWSAESSSSHIVNSLTQEHLATRAPARVVRSYLAPAAPAAPAEGE